MTGFRSMGCDVVVSGGLPVAALRELFDARERRFSRFLPSSELNRVNAAPLGMTLVSEELASMTLLSLDAARATGGLVTPCIGGALLAAGYDRDFSLLPGDVGAVWPAAVPSWRTVSVRGNLLMRTETVQLDLNGVVKGRTVDDALTLAGGGWVCAGGDLATTERVVVALPAGGAVALEHGGLATSSVRTRRWLADGVEQSHLIDPTTGTATDSPWSDVTVAAETCLAADVAAKAALLLGLAGPRWLDDRRLAGRFVDRAGAVLVNGAWAERDPQPLAA